MTRERLHEIGRNGLVMRFHALSSAVSGGESCIADLGIIKMYLSAYQVVQKLSML
jgi:hypothetical protein